MAAEKLPSRAEMAEELPCYCQSTSLSKHLPACPANYQKFVIDLFRQRDERVIEFVAANFEYAGDDDGRVVEVIAKAIRALKEQLK